MRAQIERQPLTTSCLGVTAQPHLSVCVPRWTQPEGQWLQAQLCICVACCHIYKCLLVHAHTGVCISVIVRAHTRQSIAVFMYVPMRTGDPISVSKLALSLRQIRWVNKCWSFAVLLALTCYWAHSGSHERERSSLLLLLFPSIRPKALGQTTPERPRLLPQPQASDRGSVLSGLMMTANYTKLQYI